MPVKSIWNISFVIALLGFLSPNPLEFMATVLTIPFLCSLFLKYEGFVVVLFGFLWQWIGVTIKVIYGFFTGLRLENVLPKDTSPDHIYQAFWLSLFGIWLFALGFYYATAKVRHVPVNQWLSHELSGYSPRKMVLFLIAFEFAFTALYAFRFAVPGLNSIMSVLGQIKWGFFLATFYIVHKQNADKKIFYIYSAFLFITGFGFFSNFKEVLIFLIIGIITIQARVSFKQYVLVLIGILFIARIALIWTAVKGEYRMFLSGGQRTITVVRSQSESLLYLWDLVSDVKGEDITNATDDLVSRIGYIDYFSLTLNHVPQKVPHQGGDIWSGALAHILMPRMFFPNKGIIDDSEHTSKYTGRYFSGLGTASFSLGYTADAYIDFGKFMMFLPILLLGFVMGKMFQFLLFRSHNIVWGVILTAPFYFFTNVYGMNTNKVLGLLFAYFILIFIVRKYLIRWLNPFMVKPPEVVE